jgi:hypothetical protein
MRNWLARKLFLWSCRLNEEWHRVTVTDVDGNFVAGFGAYQDVSFSWANGYDGDCTCERG